MYVCMYVCMYVSNRSQSITRTYVSAFSNKNGPNNLDSNRDDLNQDALRPTCFPDSKIKKIVNYVYFSFKL